MRPVGVDQCLLQLYCGDSTGAVRVDRQEPLLDLGVDGRLTHKAYNLHKQLTKKIIENNGCQKHLKNQSKNYNHADLSRASQVMETTGCLSLSQACVMYLSWRTIWQKQDNSVILCRITKWSILILNKFWNFFFLQILQKNKTIINECLVRTCHKLLGLSIVAVTSSADNLAYTQQ